MNEQQAISQPKRIFRVSDLVSLRRVLRAESLVMRVNPNNTIVPVELLPGVVMDRSLRIALGKENLPTFTKATQQAANGAAATMLSIGEGLDDIVLLPIFDDESDECRFVIAWVRTNSAKQPVELPGATRTLSTGPGGGQIYTAQPHSLNKTATAGTNEANSESISVSEGLQNASQTLKQPAAAGSGQPVSRRRRRNQGGPTGRPSTDWTQLRTSEVRPRFKAHSKRARFINVEPVWQSSNGMTPLWEHAEEVAAVGMATSVMTQLFHFGADAAAASTDSDVSVRLSIPSADYFGNIVPSVNGTLRASGLEPHRLVVAVPVVLASDENLMPVIIHLRTLGARIDIVGLDALTANLHAVSDTSDYVHSIRSQALILTSSWHDEFQDALVELELF